MNKEETGIIIERNTAALFTKKSKDWGWIVFSSEATPWPVPKRAGLSIPTPI